MARTQFIVVKHEGEWKINTDGKRSAPYRTQKEAIRAAVDAAHKAGREGRDSQVLIQGEDNAFRTEWTYGNDPYPPVG